MKKWLSKAQLTLLASLPVVVFFTNFPLISLGANSSMNFEISLPMIWLALFDLVSLRKLGNILKLFKKHAKILLAASILSFFLVLSCIWSANPLRGILTAGIVLAIFYAILSIFAEIPNKKFLVRELKIFLITSLVVSVFCILQGFLDVYKMQNNLLCAGCHYQTLGFPHSNGFAIEPQFMGNLLIAPCLISLDILYKKIKSKKGKGWFKFALFTFVQILALFICFSRGAIYAFALGVFLLACHAIYHKRYMRPVIYITMCIISCLSGIFLQGVWAEISPTSEDFFDGISRSVDQLTLGKIKIPRPKIVQNFDKKIAVLEPKEESQFDGYIEESTDIRLSLNELALKTWKQNPKTILFGVGLGGAGSAIAEYTGEISEHEIVQNEFLTLLLETGLVGCVLILMLAIRLLINRGKPCTFLFCAIIIAYIFSMNFFSGITNVWHIYLFTPVLYLLPGIRQSKATMLK